MKYDDIRIFATEPEPGYAPRPFDVLVRVVNTDPQRVTGQAHDLRLWREAQAAHAPSTPLNLRPRRERSRLRRMIGWCFQ